MGFAYVLTAIAAVGAAYFVAQCYTLDLSANRSFATGADRFAQPPVPLSLKLGDDAAQRGQSADLLTCCPAECALNIDAPDAVGVRYRALCASQCVYPQASCVTISDIATGYVGAEERTRVAIVECTLRGQMSTLFFRYKEPIDCV